MRTFIIRRLLLFIPTVFGVCSLVFAVLHLMPGDPVDMILGETALPVDKENLRVQLGLNDPLYIQYMKYISRLLRGDFDRSIIMNRNEPVSDIIIERVPGTILLAVCSLIIAVSLGIPAGIIAALKRNTLTDYCITVLSLVGISMPNFWLGPLLIMLLSYQFRIFPMPGEGGWMTVILPSITLGTAMMAILARMTRSVFLEILNRDFIIAARARGLPEYRIILKHALANGMIPLITIIGMQIGGLFTGAIITETVFSWQGIGSLTIEAIQNRDYPVVQGCALFIAITYVCVNLITDILYAAADPRIKLE
ncbi:MAG: glutathione ABC transporter permease GsiC [Candidatus Schekmanbacteria bacterium RBG_13_48_7]|uniref:Glutathione ABC transporter permease GsiC n=1 Tax=Candidatus Schekmanbacteria bacterium RBG_13_48_7 TaxID=1817878 RepID=A0A1F7RNI5_9BACT|nr:MAG: glutathione ABC transporter permease GsiC [Candidatus Schekmanbacteria bacterium RBG_13_48_7]